MSETRIDRMSVIKSYISNQKNVIQHDDFFGRRLDIA
ncbi:glycosyltransferase family 8 protein, partial [Salmonella enterica]|nr:glycosyltransferase family 8 protein [Salmonella enterica]